MLRLNPLSDNTNGLESVYETRLVSWATGLISKEINFTQTLVALVARRACAYVSTIVFPTLALEWRE